MGSNLRYSENLKNAIRLLGSRFSSNEKRMLIEVVGFAFEEGRIFGKEELLDENKYENENEKEEETTNKEEESIDTTI